MYEIVFSSQQSKAEDFWRHCCNVLFPHVRQQLTKKMKQDHQQSIEEKKATIALLADDLQDCNNQTQAIQYENMALQAQKDVYQAESQKCQDAITHLKTRYVLDARDPDKDNIIIIVQKHTTSTNDKFMTCHIMSRGYKDVKGMLS